MYYFTKDKDKLVFINLELTEEENKIKIPKSIISTNGIFDSTVKEFTPSYIKSLSYRIVKDSTGRESLTELNKLLESIDNDIVYCLSPEYKKYIEDRGIVRNHPGKLIFDKIDNITFINTLRDELLNIDYTDDYINIDLDEYLKSKLVLDDLIDTNQIFFNKTAPTDRYYSYRNKETISKRDSIGLDVPKSRIVLGKNSSTNIYSIIKVKPLEEISELYNKWESNLEYDLYGIMMLDNLCKTKNIFYRDNLIFRDTPRRIDSPTNDTLISEIKPAGLAFYGFKTFDYLDTILDDYLSEGDNVVKQSTVDITNMIYEDSDIKHDNGFHIDYKYSTNGKEYMIKLISGLDMPDRNRLKRLIKKNVKIKLIIINEDNIMCRHYVIVDCEDGQLLICNYPANMTLLNDK